MKIYQEYIINLNHDEAIALKKILGKESHNSRKEKGLSEDESSMISLLYDQLPDEEE